MVKYIYLLLVLVLIIFACQSDDLEKISPENPLTLSENQIDTILVDTLSIDTTFVDTLHIDSFSFTLPEVSFNYENLNLPSHIGNNTQLQVYAASNTPSWNQRTNAGASLGRVLFYDPRLSANNTISCGSCHHQDKAFSTNTQFSTGIHGNISSRNSMSLLNLRYFQDFFWDMGADGLEEQVLLPIEDPLEMGQNLDTLVNKLARIEEYPQLFENAFGSDEITIDGISRAMAQFLRSIVAFNSKFDQGVDNNFSNFTQLELDGHNLFYGGDLKCNHCHASYNFFTRLEPAMNGLEIDSNDLGFYAKTGNMSDIGKFKVVSLRNIELTAPYMHDGRFETLEEVIEHYNSGMVAHPNLDSRLTVEHEDGGTPINFNLTDYEKLDAEKYADPFED